MLFKNEGMDRHGDRKVLPSSFEAEDVTRKLAENQDLKGCPKRNFSKSERSSKGPDKTKLLPWMLCHYRAL